MLNATQANNILKLHRDWSAEFVLRFDKEWSAVTAQFKRKGQ